jgi:hypothetical protein
LVATWCVDRFLSNFASNHIRAFQMERNASTGAPETGTAESLPQHRDRRANNPE